MLRAMADLYTFWLRQASYGQQAKNIWLLHKDRLTAKVAKAVQAIVIALSSGNEADISLAEGLTECCQRILYPYLATKPNDRLYPQTEAAAKGVKTCIPGRTNRMPPFDLNELIAKALVFRTVIIHLIYTIW